MMERYSSKWETPSTVKGENRFFVVLKQILDFFFTIQRQTRQNPKRILRKKNKKKATKLKERVQIKKKMKKTRTRKNLKIMRRKMKRKRRKVRENKKNLTSQIRNRVSKIKKNRTRQSLCLYLVPRLSPRHLVSPRTALAHQKEIIQNKMQSHLIAALTKNLATNYDRIF